MPLFGRKPAPGKPVVAPPKGGPAAASTGNVAAPAHSGTTRPTDASVQASGAASPSPTAPAGPYDAASAPENAGPLVDLGSLKIPAVNGMQVRLEIDRVSQLVTGVTIMIPQPNGLSSLQLQAFAAPKRSGIWDEIRAEIAEGIQGAGGTIDDVPGPFGRELISRIPGRTPDGVTSTQAARFIGVDGPRWFLRGVITGPAATDEESAKALEDMFRRTVVVRGEDARPPRDLLALTLPGQVQPAADAAMAKANANAQLGFNPLQRGPEMTETR